MTESLEPAVAQNSAKAQNSAAAQNDDAFQPTGPEARRYGFPAVCGHEVVALRTVTRED